MPECDLGGIFETATTAIIASSDSRLYLRSGKNYECWYLFGLGCLIAIFFSKSYACVGNRNLLISLLD